MKKKLLKLLFIICCIGTLSPTVNGQGNRQKIDSLLNLVNASKKDSMEVLTLVRISREYLSFQIDSAHYFCDKGIALAKKVNYNTGLRFALKIKGTLFREKSEYDSALVYFNLLKEQCPNTGNQTCLMEYYNNAAGCYEKIGDFTTALNYYFYAAKICEAQNDFRRLSVTFNNVSAIYRIHLNDLNASYSYALQAIDLAEKTNELELKGTANERAASALADLGKYDSALHYARKSLDYYEQLTSCPDCVVGQYAVIADIFIKVNNADSALVYANKGVEMGKELTQQEYYMDALLKLSKALSMKGRNDQAINVADDAMEIAESMERYDLKYLVYETYIFCYQKSTDYKNALLYKDSLQALDDSLNSIEVKNNLNNLKLKYETDKKENEIARLNSEKKIQQLILEKQKAVIAGNVAEAKQKQQEIDLLSQQQQIQDLKLTQQHEALALKELESQTKDRQLKITEQEKLLQDIELNQQRFSKNLILAGAIVLLTFSALGFNIYRINTKRGNEREKFQLQNQLSEMRLEALRSQMNPHFIFNALNSINRYIVRSNKETASEYLVKFSKLMRLILENSKSSFIPLSNELEALRLYVEMELLRFDNKFDFNIHVAVDVLQDKTQIPPMVLQPFIENAIWHGLMNKKDKGNITVHVENRNEGKIFVAIEDNGVGRKKAVEQSNHDNHSGKSFGMQITRDRLAGINGSEKHFRIIDLTDDNNNPTGTRIEIEITTIAA